MCSSLPNQILNICDAELHLVPVLQVLGDRALETAEKLHSLRVGVQLRVNNHEIEHRQNDGVLP